MKSAFLSNDEYRAARSSATKSSASPPNRPPSSAGDVDAVADSEKGDVHRAAGSSVAESAQSLASSADDGDGATASSAPSSSATPPALLALLALADTPLRAASLMIPIFFINTRRWAFFMKYRSSTLTPPPVLHLMFLPFISSSSASSPPAR